jgi:hypothetical protein
LVPPFDRAFSVGPEKKKTIVKQLTVSIATNLHEIHLSRLNDAQKDELGLLIVSEVPIHSQGLHRLQAAILLFYIHIELPAPKASSCSHNPQRGHSKSIADLKELKARPTGKRKVEK